MTAIAMNYVVNPMTGFFSKLGHWIVEQVKLQARQEPPLN